MPVLVESEFHHGVLTVRLQRAEKRNALSTVLLAQLKTEFLSWREREDVRVAVLIGAGDRAFAAGGDLKELMGLRSRAEALAFSNETRAVLDSIRRFPVPVIAALNGDAFGGGAELALACDMRFAASHARIGFLQSTLAICTAWGGGSDLMRLVVSARALELLISGEILNAQRALDLNVVSRIAEGHTPFAVQAQSYAASFAGRPRQVLRAFKSLAIAYRDGVPLKELVAVESDQFVTTWVHHDHWLAVAAVLAKP